MMDLAVGTQFVIHVEASRSETNTLNAEVLQVCDCRSDCGDTPMLWCANLAWLLRHAMTHFWSPAAHALLAAALPMPCRLQCLRKGGQGYISRVRIWDDQGQVLGQYCMKLFVATSSGSAWREIRTVSALALGRCTGTVRSCAHLSHATRLVCSIRCLVVHVIISCPLPRRTCPRKRACASRHCSWRKAAKTCLISWKAGPARTGSSQTLKLHPLACRLAQVCADHLDNRGSQRID